MKQIAIESYQTYEGRDWKTDAQGLAIETAVKTNEIISWIDKHQASLTPKKEDI